MALQLRDLRNIADIINAAIAKSAFTQSLNIDPGDISISETLPGLLQWMNVNNPLSELLGRLTTNRYFDYGMFYHFKRFDKVVDIVQNKSIQVSSLFSNSSNDFAEYSEFLKRIGLIHPFIPKNIIWQRISRHYNPAAKRPVDDDRSRILVLCFVNNSHSERFWSEYAHNDTGVCIGFRFTRFEPTDLCDFRDVYYDDGYKFDFINEFNFNLIKQYKRQLLINGMTKFAKFYKRKSYDWENETRLTFHYPKENPGHTRALKNLFQLQFDRQSGRTYIELPLLGNPIPNPLFDLTIDEIICGKNITNPDFQRLEQLALGSFPGAKVWQRI